jgi:hypothetical protein
MFGLILAALWIAFGVATAGITLHAGVASALPFLWVWHIIWACVFGLVVFIIFCISGVATIGGKGEVRGAGAIGMFAVTPLLILLVVIGSALFLGGVYCVDASVATCPETGAVLPFDQWNSSMLVMGCVLYGLGLLRQMTSNSSASSSKSS